MSIAKSVAGRTGQFRGINPNRIKDNEIDGTIRVYQDANGHTFADLTRIPVDPMQITGADGKVVNLITLVEATAWNQERRREVGIRTTILDQTDTANPVETNGIVQLKLQMFGTLPGYEDTKSNPTQLTTEQAKPRVSSGTVTAPSKVTQLTSAEADALGIVED